MPPRPISENTLFYGDNLKILRQYIPDESIDLIYLDPPFNSNRNYNVLFKDESGTESEAQIEAFEDTWHWNHLAEQTYHDLVTQAPDHISKMIEALRSFVGTNQMTAYLIMMAARLVELHRVLKPTGSLYLHCDSTASHYLKIILDTIFGVKNFRNEIVWKRLTFMLMLKDLAGLRIEYSFTHVQRTSPSIACGFLSQRSMKRLSLLTLTKTDGVSVSITSILQAEGGLFTSFME